MLYAPAVLLVWAACQPLAAADDADVPRSETYLREQVRLHPADFRANHLLAQRLIQQNQIAAAIPYLEQARVIDPAHYTNSYDLALAFMRSGALSQSRQVILDLLQRSDRAELHNLLGDVEEAEGNIQEAAQQYEQAARMDPTEKNVFDLGSDLILHQGFQPAVKVFRFGVERYPKSARMRVGLGVTQYSLGQYDAAVEALCQAVDLDPADTKALDFLGKMHDISPQYGEEVLKRLARFAQIYPQNARASYYYALSLRQREPGAPVMPGGSARVLLQRAIQLEPGFAEAHYQLGLLFEEEGHPADALHEYQITVELNPGHAKGHYHLARLYQRSGQAVLAQQEFSNFEQLRSSGAGIHPADVRVK